MEKSTNHDSIKNMILNQLLAGRRITCVSVLKSLHTTELRHFIAIIRKTVNVSSVWIQKGKVRFKEYYIDNVTQQKSIKS